jgi:hypothetical protein
MIESQNGVPGLSDSNQPERRLVLSNEPDFAGNCSCGRALPSLYGKTKIDIDPAVPNVCSNRPSRALISSPTILSPRPR